MPFLPAIAALESVRTHCLRTATGSPHSTCCTLSFECTRLYTFTIRAPYIRKHTVLLTYLIVLLHQNISIQSDSQHLKHKIYNFKGRVSFRLELTAVWWFRYLQTFLRNVLFTVLRMEAALSSEALVSVKELTRRQKLVSASFYSHHSETSSNNTYVTS